MRIVVLVASLLTANSLASPVLDTRSSPEEFVPQHQDHLNYHLGRDLRQRHGLDSRALGAGMPSGHSSPVGGTPDVETPPSDQPASQPQAHAVPAEKEAPNAIPNGQKLADVLPDIKVSVPQGQDLNSPVFSFPNDDHPDDNEADDTPAEDVIEELDKIFGLSKGAGPSDDWRDEFEGRPQKGPQQQYPPPHDQPASSAHHDRPAQPAQPNRPAQPAHPKQPVKPAKPAKPAKHKKPSPQKKPATRPKKVIIVYETEIVYVTSVIQPRPDQVTERTTKTVPAPEPSTSSSSTSSSSSPPVIEKPVEKPKEEPKEAPKDKPNEKPKEQPKIEPKPQPKEEPKEAPKDKPKEKPKEQPKIEPKPQPKEEPKPEPKVEPKPEPKIEKPKQEKPKEPEKPKPQGKPQPTEHKPESKPQTGGQVNTDGLPTEYVDNLECESDTYKGLAKLHHDIHRLNHSLPVLHWNDTLFEYAKETAESCIYGHSLTPGGGGYGQNIASGDAPGNISAVLTNAYYNLEIELFLEAIGSWGKDQPDMSNFEKWGHATQMLWNGTTDFACYTARCSPPGADPLDCSPSGQSYLKNVGCGNGGTKAFNTVCNYYPPGNYAGEYSSVPGPEGIMGFVEMTMHGVIGLS